MRAELLQMAAELARRGEPFVLATVTWRQPPSSAQRGDTAVLTADGAFHGWLGGACTRPTVEREARAALRDGRPRLLALDPDPAGASAARPGVDVHPMTCHSGGSVEIYLEPILPAPRLVVFGGSPAARTLTRLGQAMGYAVTAVAPEPDFPGFPPGIDLRTAAREGDRLMGTASRPLYAVVATMGEDDEAALRAALGLAPTYVGLVASRRRFAEMRGTLVATGVAEAALDAVHSPAGLDLGGRTPEEIALSVLAEIVQLRRAAEPTGRSAAAAPASAPPAPDPENPPSPGDMTRMASSPFGIVSPSASPPASSQLDSPEFRIVSPSHADLAVDPICGMTVEIAGARHRAEHAGRTWYFCCGGCRERFLADPERWAAAEAGG
jgi:xanthine dehydrogenase accessory factor